MALSAGSILALKVSPRANGGDLGAQRCEDAVLFRCSADAGLVDSMASANSNQRVGQRLSRHLLVGLSGLAGRSKA